MFTKDIIAPCGLNCGICRQALFGETKCMGCNGPDELKTEYCRTECPMKHCELRKAVSGGFCDGCEKYPCGDMMERETRYANAYPMAESPMGNLAWIRKDGMDSFLKAEEERWKCPECGGIISVHNGTCAGCGREYTIRRMK